MVMLPHLFVCRRMKGCENGREGKVTSLQQSYDCPLHLSDYVERMQGNEGEGEVIGDG